MFLISRSVESSKNSARQKYTIPLGGKPSGNRRITWSAFNALVGLDPTPNKRYLEKICLWFVYPTDRLDFTLRDTIPDSGTFLDFGKFGGSGYDIFAYFSVNEWDRVQSNYRNDRGIDRLILKDIDLDDFQKSFVPKLEEYEQLEKKFNQKSWMVKGLDFDTYEDFIRFLTDTAASLHAEEKTKDIMNRVMPVIKKTYGNSVLKDDDKVLLVTVENFEFSHDLGSAMKPDSPWCVQRDSDTWDDYLKNRLSRFYYFVDKVKGEQYYIQFKMASGAIYVWDEEDKTISHIDWEEMKDRCEIDSDDLEPFYPEPIERYDGEQVGVTVEMIYSMFNLTERSFLPNWIGDYGDIGGEDFSGAGDVIIVSAGELDEGKIDYGDEIYKLTELGREDYKYIRRPISETLYNDINSGAIPVELKLSPGVFLSLGIYLPDTVEPSDSRKLVKEIEQDLQTELGLKIKVHWDPVSGGSSDLFGANGPMYVDGEHLDYFEYVSNGKSYRNPFSEMFFSFLWPEYCDYAYLPDSWLDRYYLYSEAALSHPAHGTARGEKQGGGPLTRYFANIIKNVLASASDKIFSGR